MSFYAIYKLPSTW